MKHFFCWLLLLGGGFSGTAQRFALPTFYAPGPNAFPHDVAVGDLNGDGYPDLVLTTNGIYPAAGLRVLLNQQNGTFAPAVVYPSGMGTRTSNVVLSDFNQDGFADVVTSDFLSGAILVFFNQQDGTFAPVTRHGGPLTSSGQRAYAVAVGDLNQDGYPDIVTANVNGGSVGVLLNQQNSTFSALTFYTTGASSSRPTAVAVRDLNGDGSPDVVAALAEPASIGPQGVAIWLNQGSGSFAPASLFAGTGATSVAVDDLNQDGSPDIVTAMGAAGVGVWFSQSGPLAPPVLYAPAGADLPFVVALGDVNGDGRSDLLTVSANSSLEVRLSQAGGALGAGVRFPMAIDGAAFGDVNRDGRLDMVVVSNIPGQVGVLLNTGTFTPLSTRARTGLGQATLFPNPARARVSLLLPDGSRAQGIDGLLTDAVGRLVRRLPAALPGAGGRHELDLTGVVPGLYHLHLRAGEEYTVRLLRVE